MTFVKFNPELMQAYINDLDSYAEAADVARSSIQASSRNNDHPVESVDEATRTSPLFVDPTAGSGSCATTMAAAIAALTSLAEELRARRQEIIDLNSSGVSLTAPDGTTAYYLPEGVEDTLANMRAYNTQAATTATADATALTQARSSKDGTADDGRTTDQILTDIAKYQDNPAYGTTFVNAAGGAQGYIDLVYDVDGYYRYSYEGDDSGEAFSNTMVCLGHVLAAASQVNGGVLAQDCVTAVTSTDKPGNAVALNRLLMTPDAAYGTYFLLDMAEAMEDVDPASIKPTRATWADDQQGTADPLAGVLTAMGNNPDAALGYLAPAGGGATDGEGNWIPAQATTDRWNLLTSRDWSAHHADGVEALTAAVAGASSKRVQSQDTTDERAAWVTGQGLDYFSGVEGSSFSAGARNNVALMLGNSMPDIEDAVTSSQDTSGFSQSAAQAGRPAPLAGDHAAAIKALTKVAGADDTALTTLTNAVGRHSTARTRMILDAHPGAGLGEGTEMDEALDTGADHDGQLLGFIQQSAVNARTERGADRARAEQTVASTALEALGSGLSAVPNPYAQGLGLAVSAATPGLTGMTGTPDPAAVASAQSASEDAKEQVFQSMMTQVANDGRLPEEAYTSYDDPNDDVDETTDYATGLYSDGTRNQQVKPYTWMSPDHTIDLAAVLSNTDNRNQFNRWLQDPAIPSTDITNKFNDGVDTGSDYANG